MNNVIEAMEIIQYGYNRALKDKQEAFICQLTNDNQGFNTWEIDSIKQRAAKLQFALPTHISILPVGKQPSSSKMFDGFIDIYCNNPDLQHMVDLMKRRVL